jgi:mannose-1-phosphate guanylyltransferase/mannose-6-phosphate isomerase
MPSSPHITLVLAGGSGTRLWPMSRGHYPKQFQPLLGHQSPFQHMLSLIEHTTKAEHIFIQTIPEFSEFVSSQAPSIPAANLLFEPDRRDTGPAIIFGIAAILNKYPDAIITTVWSDHSVTEPAVFDDALTTSRSIVAGNHQATVVVGAVPTRAETGYGYIHCGEQIDNKRATLDAFHALSFVEKPSSATAERYLEEGGYLWNIGYCTIHGATFWQQLNQIRSDLAQTLTALENAIQTENTALIAEIYGQLPKQSIELVITQQLPNIIAVSAAMGWSDIGSWEELRKTLNTSKANGNVTEGTVWLRDSHDNLVYASGKPIAVLGIHDSIIVETADAILVMNRRMAPAELKQFISDTLSPNHPELL